MVLTLVLPVALPVVLLLMPLPPLPLLLLVLLVLLVLLQHMINDGIGAPDPNPRNLVSLRS